MAQLQPSLRILDIVDPTHSQHTTVDDYINNIYKDIFARYLIAKGVGYLWKGSDTAGYGMAKHK